MADPLLERMGEFMVRHPWLITVPLALVAVIALGVGVVNFQANQHTQDRVTRIEQSPCQANPAGPECARVRRQTAKREPLSVPCISFRRIVQPRSVYRRFTRCGDYRRRQERGSDATDPTRAAPVGAPDTGDGSSSDGSDQPAPSDPPTTVPPPDPPATNPPSPPQPPSPPSNPPPSSLGGQLGEAVDGVTDLGCELTNALGVCVR